MQVLYRSWKGYLEKSGKGAEEPLVMPWLFSKAFRQQYPERVREIRDRLAKGYLPRNSKAFERQMKANVSHDTRDRLTQISLPTLILAGRGDELTPPNMAEALKAAIPGAELLIFEQGGHGLYWEVPDLFNRAVLEFLKSQEGTGTEAG